MADNYTALKSAQKKRYISKETFNSLDLSQVPVGSEYEVVSPIEKGDLSADINNALNKAEKSISEPTNQTTGSDGDVLVKKGGGSEWKSMTVPAVLQQKGQSTTDVMSQKATTDSLNLLEAKLNENIVKDPSKVYFVVKGNQLPPSSAIGRLRFPGSLIDWGDGSSEIGVGDPENPSVDDFNTHTYTDGIEYHLVSVSNITKLLNGLFYYYYDTLIDFYMANTITEIGNSVFAGARLKKITIPQSVTKIDDIAIFADIVIMEGNTPPEVSAVASFDNPKKIIVPKSAINAYKAATGWSQYADKIVYEVDSSDLPDTSKFAKLDGDNEFKGMIIFDQPIWLYGNKPTIKDVDNNTFYLPAKPNDPGWTYTLATTDDVDAKSSFSVEVW